MKYWISLLVFVVGCFIGAASAHAGPVCLTPGWNNTYAYWENKCDFKVWVNWDDGGVCHDYSCSSMIAPHHKEPATISRSNEVAWCEFHNGKTGRCDQSGVASEGSADGGSNTNSSGGEPSKGNNPPSAADFAKYGRCAGETSMMSELDRLYDFSGDLFGGYTIVALNDWMAQAMQRGGGSGANWDRVVRLQRACG